MVLLALGAWALYAVLLWGRMRARLGRAAASPGWPSPASSLLLVIRFAAVPYLSGFHTYGG